MLRSTTNIHGTSILHTDYVEKSKNMEDTSCKYNRTKTRLHRQGHSHADGSKLESGANGSAYVAFKNEKKKDKNMVSATKEVHQRFPSRDTFDTQSSSMGKQYREGIQYTL